jgi:hypothetical protein
MAPDSLPPMPSTILRAWGTHTSKPAAEPLPPQPSSWQQQQEVPEPLSQGLHLLGPSIGLSPGLPNQYQQPTGPILSSGISLASSTPLGMSQGPPASLYGQGEFEQLLPGIHYNGSSSSTGVSMTPTSLAPAAAPASAVPSSRVLAGTMTAEQLEAQMMSKTQEQHQKQQDGLVSSDGGLLAMLKGGPRPTPMPGIAGHVSPGLINGGLGVPPPPIPGMMPSRPPPMGPGGPMPPYAPMPRHPPLGLGPHMMPPPPGAPPGAPGMFPPPGHPMGPPHGMPSPPVGPGGMGPPLQGFMGGPPPPGFRPGMLTGPLGPMPPPRAGVPPPHFTGLRPGLPQGMVPPPGFGHMPPPRPVMGGQADGMNAAQVQGPLGECRDGVLQLPG